MNASKPVHFFTPLRICILLFVLLSVFLYICFDLLDPLGDTTDSSGDSGIADSLSATVEPAIASSSDDEVSQARESDTAPENQEGEANQVRERERIAEIGDSTYCIRGRVSLHEREPVPEGLHVTVLTRKPPLSTFPLKEGDARSQPRFHLATNLAQEPTFPVAAVDGEGFFILKGVPGQMLFLNPTSPFFRSRYGKGIQPWILTEAEDQAPTREEQLVIEPAGVVDGKAVKPDGSPAAGAEITLRGELSPFFIFSGNQEIVSSFTVEAGEDGSFRFEQVPAGHPLLLEAVLEGFAPRHLSPVNALAGKAVQLALAFEAPAVIAGVVKHASGEPAAGIDLSLTLSNISFGDMQKMAQETKEETDDSGRFRFGDLKEGTYKVMLVESGYTRDVVGGIKVQAGERVDDLKFVLNTGLSISGTVSDSTGAPMANALVKVKRSFSLLEIANRLSDELHPMYKGTDENGAFIVQGLEAGNHDIEVNLEGYSPYSEEGIVAGTQGLQIRLVEGCHIKGIVISASSGEPVTAYNLVLDQTKGGAAALMDPFGLQNQRRLPVNDEKGKFTVSSLAAGTYNLTVRAEGFSTQKINRIVVNAGESVDGIIFALPEEASISGTVLDAVDRAPIEGATISRESGIKGMVMNMIGSEAVQTDAYGSFCMGGLDAGPVRLTIMHSRYEEASLEEINLLESENRSGIQILLSRGSMIKGHVWDSRRRPRPSVTVFVANMTGTRLKSDRTNEEGYYEISGLPKGSYNITLMPDSFSLGGEGFMESFVSKMKTQVVKLEKDDVQECDFIEGEEESEGTEVTGTVRAAGKAKGSYFLQLHKAGSDTKPATPLTTTTNHEGVYRFKDIEPGKYALLVTITGELVGAYSMVSYEIDVPKRSPFEYDIDLPGACIAGEVLDSSGRSPLKNVRVGLYLQGLRYSSTMLSESMGMRVAEQYTGDKGRFRFTHLKPGKYNLRVGGDNLLGLDSGGFAFRMFEGIRLGDDEQKDSMTVELEAGGILEGRVTDAGGDPISSAGIHVKGPGQTSFQERTECRTDGSGFFRYTCLMPGTWTVQIRHNDYAPVTEQGVLIVKKQSSTLNCILRP